MSPALALPSLETDRLRLRVPTIADETAFAAFLGTERARFVGGPISDRRTISRAWGTVAGLWLLRGYSFFVAERKDTGRAIGHIGPWYPSDWPEPEFGWSLWRDADEGRGYVTEAMRRIMPWAFEVSGRDSFISAIDPGNAGSIRVAEALGAERDDAAAQELNAPGGAFHDATRPAVLIYRHRRTA